MDTLKTWHTPDTAGGTVDRASWERRHDGHDLTDTGYELRCYRCREKLVYAYPEDGTEDEA